MTANPGIKTFAFLDLETTGLPFEEHNKTKITELCFVAIKSRDIDSRRYPRVQHKVNLCFYPEKLINTESERLTGLSNDLLEYEPRFKKQAADVINNFLGLLEKPVCLVAHHGDYFDYPILKAEMQKAGCPLGDDLLCVDSIKAFIQFYEEDSRVEAVMLCEDAGQEVGNFEKVGITDHFETVGIISNKRCAEEAQVINETTPPRKFKVQEFHRVSPANIDHLYHHVGGAREDNGAKESRPSARKQLHFGKPSFKLVDLYTKLTKKPPLASHRAEEDVLMLMECTLTLGRRFTQWAEQRAVTISAVPTMTPGRKIGT